MRRRSSVIVGLSPTGSTPPTTLVPPPKGMTAIPRSAAASSTAATCASVSRVDDGVCGLARFRRDGCERGRDSLCRGCGPRGRRCRRRHVARRQLAARPRGLPRPRREGRSDYLVRRRQPLAVAAAAQPLLEEGPEPFRVGEGEALPSSPQPHHFVGIGRFPPAKRSAACLGHDSTTSRMVERRPPGKARRGTAIRPVDGAAGKRATRSARRAVPVPRLLAETDLRRRNPVHQHVVKPLADELDLSSRISPSPGRAPC